MYLYKYFIFRYIYTGKLDLVEQFSEDILNLLIASDELLLEELVKFLQEYLVEQRQNWVHKNFVFVLNTICNLTSCKILQDHCFETIYFDPELLITLDDFPKLEKDILYDLLERDDLLIKEIVAWDHLIKWGIEQTPGLGSENCDKNKWNDEDYEALKKTLEQFIPLIRFTEIAPDDFNDKIRPYKNIIPNQIYEEIESFYYNNSSPTTLTLSQPRIGKLDSKIIKPKLAKIIINWIDKKDFFTLSYKFDLIYRGSIDGINVESFKNKCKGQFEGLVLIKVKFSNKILGGYSSIGFHSIGNNVQSFGLYDSNSKYYYSLDNFIFSFENNEDTQNMKISRVINYDRAMYDHINTGFDFGFNSLYMYNNQCLYGDNADRNYESNLNVYVGYEIEEIETFIITK
jgi:hypothetical protein